MKSTKSTKRHEKKQKLESADICATRDYPLTCIFLFLHFLYYFREFRAFRGEHVILGSQLHALHGEAAFCMAESPNQPD